MSRDKREWTSRLNYSRHLRKTLLNRRRGIRNLKKKESLILMNLKISLSRRRSDIIIN